MGDIGIGKDDPDAVSARNLQTISISEITGKFAVIQLVFSGAELYGAVYSRHAQNRYMCGCRSASARQSVRNDNPRNP